MTDLHDTCARELRFDVGDRALADSDAIPCVVSTDDVVAVPDYGREILSHEPGAIDLSRAPLPIVVTHDENQLNVGIVENLRVDGGMLRGDARFGSRPEAAGYDRDVRAKIIRSLSVKYFRIRGHFRADGVRVTTHWLPTHAAMVAEPADIGAGFYRALQAAPATRVPPLEGEPSQPPKESTMTEPVIAPGTNPNPAEQNPNPSEPGARGLTTPAQPRQGPGSAELEADRIAAITNICKANNIDEGIRSLWVSGGATMRQVSDEVIGILAERSKNTPKATQIGLTGRETQAFSLSRAIEACAAQNWTQAGFEAECSRAIQQKLNRNPSPNRFFVPWEVQERSNRTPVEALAYELMKRDLTVAAAGNGGYLKETANVGFIELLRNKSVLMNMGAMRLSGLVGDVTIPKQSATGSATWLANESATISEINQTFVQVALSPKNVGGYTEISRQLLLQSNPYVEGLVMSDLAAVVALDIDAKGLNGSGASGQPTGILNTSGIGSVTGTSLDYADIVEFQTDVFAGNALTGNSGYVTTGAVAGLLKARVKFSSTASPIWNGRLDSADVDGYRGMASNQMPSATMLFGDFGLGVVIAEWGVLEVEVNPYANFQAGIVGVRAIASVDIGVRYPTAFSAASSIT